MDENQANNDRNVIKVLLVEDSAFDAELVNSVLSLAVAVKFENTHVDSLGAAVDILNQQRFDAVLLDMFLPDSKGIDTIKSVKKLSGDSPVVILSAAKDTELAVQALKEGADDFLVKGQTKLSNLPRVIRYAIERMRIKLELAEARKEAEEATKLKDKFVSLVAHDLKSPFAAILGLLSIIDEDKENPVHPYHKELIGNILESARRQTGMINELLNISRLQTGQMTLEKRFMDAQIIAHSAISGAQYLADKKGVVLRNDVKPGSRIYADLDLYLEVLKNLITNSVKFTNRGDEVRLYTPDADKTSIIVEDTGVGIPEKILPKLFKHEVKTSTPGTNGEKGTGLGLPFCHEIMAAHGGSISVESVEGKGAVFCVKLPDVKPKVLLVDDDVSIQRLIKSFLKGIDIDIVVLDNGRKAIDFLENNTCHLVLLDLIMPELDGFQTLEHMRSVYATKNIPVIIISVDKNIETRDKVFQLGANDFVNKPILKEDFIPRMRRFIC